MGSVISSVACPHCKYPEAYEDFYYKIGIAWIFCHRCGYNNEWENVYNQDPEAEVYETVHGGHGCFTVGIGGSGSLYGLDFENLAEELKKTFKPEDFHTADGKICDNAKVTYLKDGKWMLYDLFTKTEVEFDTKECENK